MNVIQINIPRYRGRGWGPNPLFAASVRLLRVEFFLLAVVHVHEGLGGKVDVVARLAAVGAVHLAVRVGVTASMGGRDLIECPHRLSTATSFYCEGFMVLIYHE